MRKGFCAFFCLWVALSLGACGKKGALYLPADEQEKTSRPLLASQSANEITPDVLNIQKMAVVGHWRQIHHRNTQSWKTVFDQSRSDNDLLRYAVFSKGILSDQTPIKFLIGKVRETKVSSQEARRIIQPGVYLRFRSLVKGADRIPYLIEQARKYLIDSPFERLNTSDFIIDRQNTIDLYIAVRRR